VYDNVIDLFGSLIEHAFTTSSLVSFLGIVILD
jgi:hypothetical protein